LALKSLERSLRQPLVLKQVGTSLDPLKFQLRDKRGDSVKVCEMDLHLQLQMVVDVSVWWLVVAWIHESLL
jgi:hypothetical protein